MTLLKLLVVIMVFFIGVIVVALLMNEMILQQKRETVHDPIELEKIKYIQDFLLKENGDVHFTKRRLRTNGFYDTTVQLAISDYMKFYKNDARISNEFMHDMMDLVYTTPISESELTKIINNLDYVKYMLEPRQKMTIQ